MLIREFTSFEDEALLNFTIDNKINLWQMSRFDIFNELLKKEFKIYVVPPNVRKTRLLNFKYIYLTLTKNPMFIKRSFDILTIGPAMLNSIKINKKYFNRIYDYYNFVYEDNTVMLEDSYNYAYYYPRAFRNLYYRDYIKLKPLIINKIIKYKINAANRKKITDFIFCISKQFVGLNNQFLNNLKNHLIKIISLIPTYEYFYNKIIEKVRPKIVFLNMGSYGIENYLIALLKDAGVVVGEFQHGVITEGHAAYNYGKNVFNSKNYKRYLPDYLLTYGDFWNKKMSIPVKKITIGNPHFWYSYDKVKNNSRSYGQDKHEKIILIVSQETVTDVNIKIAKELSKKINNKYRIIFRLHPGERRFEGKYRELYGFSNVLISKTGDIYKLIERSDFIVSIYSTTIFEATALGKRVYVYKHPLSKIYIPKDMVIWFENVDELYELIRNNAKSKTNYSIDYFWNRNWKRNYMDFIENQVGL